MRKRVWIALVVLLVVMAVILVACRKPTAPTDGKQIYDVSSGTAAVGMAIERALAAENADNLYMSWRFVVDEGPDTYDVVYDFAALLDLDSDENSKLAFKCYTDIENLTLTEVYYQGGTLYLNHQPAIDRAAVRDVSLSRIASTLATSAQSGQVRDIISLLPALGDRVFSACERTVDGDKTTYAFTVDYDSLGKCIAYLVEHTGLLSSAEMTRLLGLNAVDATQNTQLLFVTVKDAQGEEIFESATCRSLPAGADADAPAITKSLQSFEVRPLGDVAAREAANQPSMPDNLASFSYYHPANLNLLGTLTLDINSGSLATTLFSHPFNTYISTYQYTFDVSLQSNVDVLGQWTASLVLTNREDRSRHIGVVYADSTLYLDMSSLQLGRWKVSAAELQRIATATGRARDVQTLTADNWRDIVLDLLVDRVETAEEVTYTLKPTAINQLYNVIQQTLTQNAVCTLPPVDVNSMQLVVNTRNNTFHNLSLSAAVWGCNVTLLAENPKVGAAVAVSVPAWCADCLTPTAEQTITPVASGIVRSYSISNSNTALLESFIYSVSGTTVDLGSEEVYYYHFAANITGKGKVNVISVDFDTDHNKRICSLYYHSDTPDNLYVIMPSTGGDTEVLTLTMRQDMRYVDFVRAVNGNVDIRETAECTLSNTQSSASLTWSKAGLDAMLGRLDAVLGEISMRAVPGDLGLQGLRLTVGAESAVRLIFGGERFIDFGLDSFSLESTPLTLTSNVKVAGVSYFDAYNLPERITVSVGDGSAETRNMSVRLSDFDTDWAFEDIPAMGSGNRLVTAYCTVLGQRVSVDFGVDCSQPDRVVVVDSTAYADKLEDNVFTFARYNDADSPLAAIGSFRYAKIYMGARTKDMPITWLHNGVDIQSADWSTPDREDGPNSDYTILPAVANFFGQVVTLDAYTVGGQTTTLTGAYTLRLAGNKISTIKDAGNYMTLATYTGASYDPFDQATYNSANPQFFTANNIEVTDVREWKWDVDSIDNKGQTENGIRDVMGNLYTKDALVQALREQLYALNGRYSIGLQVYNVLGVVERRISVTVNVSPYVVRSVTFSNLADGVTFTSENNEYKGRFDLSVQTRTAIGNSFAFARVAEVTFDNGEVHAFDARDWTVEPIDEVLMFRAYQGGVVLTVGDSAGGRQTISLHYTVAAAPVDGVALWGWRNGVQVELADSLQPASVDTQALNYTFDDVNPYDYILPAGLAIHYLSDVQYLAYDFTFAGWDENKLWWSDATYVADAKVYNVAVKISMHFVPKHVSGEWSFATYREDDAGAYVFDGQDFVAYLGTPQQRGLQRYSPIASPAVIYQKSSSGAYVRYGGEYVPYDPNNDLYSGLDRYTYDLVVATPYIYEEAALGQYVYIDGAHVAYDAALHEGLTRYNRTETTNVLYRHGTDGLDRLVLDPNKVDYLSPEVYPALVVASFTDGTKMVLPAVWDLTVLQSVSPDEDYTETVPLYIAMNQRLDDVYMRIESTRPKFAYYRVQLDGEGEPILDEDGFYMGGESEIEISLLTADATGKLVVHDLNSRQEIHDLICGCSDEGCLGYLYFDYGDSTTSNSRFPITEWKRLSAIGDTLMAEAAKAGAKPLAEISFSVDVIAVARNIEHTIKVHVRASNMSDITYPLAGMPLIASSMTSGGANVYSMQADGTALTVDPYVADVFDVDNYPKQLQFNLGDKVCTAFVDSWDIAALNGITPYLGATATVYAQIETPFGYVRIPAPIEVLARSIQSVYIDGSDNRQIYINAMSAQPFGADIVVENGRTVAIRTVQVKFARDDLLYPMTMRYDITDIVAPYYGSEPSAQPISIQVGNAAGGYQTMQGYRVFTVDNDIMKVQVPVEDAAYAPLKAYLQDGGGNWDGYIYNGTFVTFDDSDAANEAWRALTTVNRNLVLYCGYVDESDVLHSEAYAATLGDEATVGVGYAWRRSVMAGQEALRLNVWNTVAVAGDHLDTAQYISTGTNRYVSLSRSMLSLVGVADTTLEIAYSHGYTVQNMLDAHAMGVVGQLLQLSQLSTNVYAAADAMYTSPLAADTLLTVGNYTWRIAVVDSPYYRGYVDIAVVVTPLVLNHVDVEVSGHDLDAAELLAGYTFHISQVLRSISAIDAVVDMDIEVQIYDSEDALLISLPYQPGTYTVRLVPADPNCSVVLSNGTDCFTLILAE